MKILEDKYIKDIRNNPINRNWFYICQQCILSESFIREFENYVDWSDITLFQKLSEEFIIEFLDKDKFDWCNVCVYQRLSEDFIRKFQDKVNWYCISQYQSLSKEFVAEFVNKISFEAILANNKISKEIKDYCRMFI